MPVKHAFSKPTHGGALSTHQHSRHVLADSPPAGHSLPATQAQHQVQGGLLLDVVVRQGAPVLQLLTSEDEALLVRRDALLVLDLLLHILHIGLIIKGSRSFVAN